MDIDKQELKRLYFDEGYNIQDLQRKYRVRTKTILNIVREFTDENTKSLKNWQRKLTRYQVVKILIERMKYGTLQKELAKKYGVSESRISSICTGRDWKHVFQGVRDKYNKETLAIKN
jgi:Mor family transcriptional regulator